MDIWLLLFVSAAFVSAAGITFAVGHLITSRNRLQRRLPAGARCRTLALTSGDNVGALVGEPFRRRSIWPWPETRQRAEAEIGARRLFQPDAPSDFTSLRASAPSLLRRHGLAGQRVALARPFNVDVCAGRGGLGRGRRPWAGRLSRLAVSPGKSPSIALNFPDLLDLLTVCVTAGLTVEASFERIRDRLSKRSRALGHNIELMGAEMRAGRSSVDALGAFADRLGLDEAASFVAVLRHSVELGGDVATTLGNSAKTCAPSECCWRRKRRMNCLSKWSCHWRLAFSR